MFWCTYVCLNNYLYIYISKHVQVNTYIYIHRVIYAYTHMWIHVCICICIQIYMYVYIYIYMYTYIYICIYICIHTCVYTYVSVTTVSSHSHPPIVTDIDSIDKLHSIVSRSQCGADRGEHRRVGDTSPWPFGGKKPLNCVMSQIALNLGNIRWNSMNTEEWETRVLALLAANSP